MYDTMKILKLTRMAYGLTRMEIANELCSETAIRRIEKNAQMPSSTLYNELMQKMGRDCMCIKETYDINDMNISILEKQIIKQFIAKNLVAAEKNLLLLKKI